MNYVNLAEIHKNYLNNLIDVQAFDIKRKYRSKRRIEKEEEVYIDIII